MPEILGSDNTDGGIEIDSLTNAGLIEDFLYCDQLEFQGANGKR